MLTLEIKKKFLDLVKQLGVGGVEKENFQSIMSEWRALEAQIGRRVFEYEAYDWEHPIQPNWIKKIDNLID